MSEKLCVFCEHFYLDMGDPGYSEFTPGTGVTIECTKQHWKMGNYEETETYRRNIIKAEGCPDYEQVER